MEELIGILNGVLGGILGSGGAGEGATGGSVGGALGSILSSPQAQQSGKEWMSNGMSAEGKSMLEGMQPMGLASMLSNLHIKEDPYVNQGANNPFVSFMQQYMGR
jgi:hypothetical protein